MSYHLAQNHLLCSYNHTSPQKKIMSTLPLITIHQTVSTRKSLIDHISSQNPTTLPIIPSQTLFKKPHKLTQNTKPTFGTNHIAATKRSWRTYKWKRLTRMNNQLSNNPKTKEVSPMKAPNDRR